MGKRDALSDDGVPVPQEGQRSDFSGSAAEVVQARDVSGGVHFHRSPTADLGVPRQLLGDVRGFVNRTAELGWLDRVLLGAGSAGLTVIVGTAGVGKTALALRWAHRAATRFPDGQLYVNLRGHDPGAPVTAEQALNRFLRALGVSPERIPDDMEGKAALYRSLLADRRVLVVLDNAAHVRQVRPLLPGGATCRVLVTSRDRLEGLMAHDGAQRVTLEILPEDEAVELIRALTADYRPEDSSADRAELARLCVRLPLALRIAAERAAARPWMPLGELIQNLRDESRLWDALSASNGEEYDGVRAVFAWSYRSFSTDAARMFRMLGLHPGPEFGVRAAAELGGVTVTTARHLLDSIVGAHMLEQTAPDRYQFHDLLRAYATDAAHHEEPLERQYEALARVLAWYMHTAYAASVAMRVWGRVLAPDALPVPDSVLQFDGVLAATQWYDLEWPNLLAAIRAAEKSGLTKVTWQLTLAASFGSRRLLVGDWHSVMTTALQAARRDGARQAEGELLALMGINERATGHLEQATATTLEALAIFREVDDRHNERNVLNELGVLLLSAREFARASEQFESLRALQHAEGDREGETAAWFNLAEAYDGVHRHDDAIDAARRSLDLSREIGSRQMELIASVFLARARANNGDVDAALADAAYGVEISREIDDSILEGWALLDYGRIQRMAGLQEDALVSYRRVVSLYAEREPTGSLARALDGTGNAYREVGRKTEAIPFHRQAVAVARQGNSAWVLGVTLDDLATALHETGEDAEATECGREASRLIAQFRDPEAIARLERITHDLP